MPRPISWLPRLHEIRKRVNGSVRSHYERREIEELFELQPRAAQLLLELLPTTKVGRSLLLEKEALSLFLSRIQDADDVPAEIEQIRKEKTPASRKKLRTLVRRDLDPLPLTSLPSNISISRCRLEIRFDTIEELANAMYALAQAIEVDGETMARLYEKPANSPTDEAANEVAAMFEELERIKQDRGIKS